MARDASSLLGNAAAAAAAIVAAARPPASTAVTLVSPCGLAGFLLKLVALYVTIALYAVLVSILLGGLLSLAEGW